MKPYLVRFYHGQPARTSRFVQKVRDMCRESFGGDFFYEGTLEEWNSGWQDKFLYITPTELESQSIKGVIWVTPYSSFDTR